MVSILFPLAILIALLLLIIKGKKTGKYIFKYDKLPDNRSIRIFFILLVFVAIGNLVTSFNYGNPVYIPILEKNFATKFFHKDSVRPVIKEYSTYKVRGTPSLSKDNPDPELSLIHNLTTNKNNLIDAFLILIVTIIGLIGLWHFDFKHPFKGELSKTVLYMSIIILLFYPLEMIKNYIVDIMIRNKTNNEFVFGNMFEHMNLVKLWIGAILFRFSQIIQHGEKIQQEQNLTV